MPTDKQVDAATVAYLKERGWDDATIERNAATRSEVRGRMVAALKAAEEAADVQTPV